MKITQEIRPRKSNAGRKWFDGKDEQVILAKLREVTALDASIEECLYYADISSDSYYRYLKSHQDFARELSKMRERPVLKARQTVISKMGESYQNAMDYLKRKRKFEFGDNVDITSDHQPLPLLAGKSNGKDHSNRKTARTDKENS